MKSFATGALSFSTACLVLAGASALTDGAMTTTELVRQGGIGVIIGVVMFLFAELREV